MSEREPLPTEPTPQPAPEPAPQSPEPGSPSPPSGESQADAAPDQPQHQDDVAKRIAASGYARRQAERREAEARAALEKTTALLERMEKRLAEPEDRPAADQTPAKPTREQFPNPDDYDAAVIEYGASLGASRAMAEWQKAEAQRRREAEERDARAAFERDQERVRKQYSDKLADFVKDHPDYDELIAETPGTPVMENAILRNPRGPEIAYYLAQNREEAMRIASLTLPNGQPDVTAQVFELGMVAAKLDAPKPPPQRVSVLTPLRGGGQTPINREPTIQEMENSYLEEQRQRRYGRT